MKINLGAKFKQMRAVKGLTLDRVSELVGIPTQSLHKYEVNTMSPRLETIEKLCDLYGYKLMIVPKGTKVAK